MIIYIYEDRFRKSLLFCKSCENGEGVKPKMDKGWPKKGCKISNQSSFQPIFTAEELNGLYFHLTFLAYIGI